MHDANAGTDLDEEETHREDGADGELREGAALYEEQQAGEHDLTHPVHHLEVEALVALVRPPTSTRHPSTRLIMIRTRCIRFRMQYHNIIIH